MWGGQGYPNKHHEHFKVIFSITREEIELPVKIGDKNLNLTQPIGNPFNNYIMDFLDESFEIENTLILSNPL